MNSFAVPVPSAPAPSWAMSPAIQPFPQQTVINRQKGPDTSGAEAGWGVAALAESTFIQMFSAIKQETAEREVAQACK